MNPLQQQTSKLPHRLLHESLKVVHELPTSRYQGHLPRFVSSEVDFKSTESPTHQNKTRISGEHSRELVRTSTKY